MVIQLHLFLISMVFLMILFISVDGVSVISFCFRASLEPLAHKFSQGSLNLPSIFSVTSMGTQYSIGTRVASVGYYH